MNDGTYEGGCYCGAVKVSVTGTPAAAGYCHCHSCRKWHSAPVNAWAIWPADAVEISGDAIRSTTDAESGRISCSKCGGCVANAKPSRNMMVVYPMSLAGSGFVCQPGFHLFYSERVLDMADGLPKFVDRPEPFGGSGETVPEPEHTRWCG